MFPYHLPKKPLVYRGVRNCLVYQVNQLVPCYVHKDTLVFLDRLLVINAYGSVVPNNDIELKRNRHGWHQIRFDAPHKNVVFPQMKFVTGPDVTQEVGNVREGVVDSATAFEPSSRPKISVA